MEAGQEESQHVKVRPSLMLLRCYVWHYHEPIQFNNGFILLAIHPQLFSQQSKFFDKTRMQYKGLKAITII